MEPGKTEDKMKTEGGAPEANNVNVVSAPVASAEPVSAPASEAASANTAPVAEASAPAANVEASVSAPVAEVAPAPATNVEASAPVSTPAVNAEASVATPAPAQAPVAPAKPAGEKVNFLQTILQTFTKPMTVLKESLPKYGSLKNAGILAGIVLVASLVLSTITTFFSVIFSFYCGGYGKSASCKATFDFEMLEYWKFGTFLFETIVSTVVVMLVLTGIFFGIAKLFKSQKANFCRCLTVVSLAMLPIIAVQFVAGFTSGFALTSATSADAGFPVFMAALTAMITMTGLVYAAVIFYEGMTREAEFEGDKKAHYTLLSTVATLVALGILIWLIGDKIGLDSFVPFLSF